MVIISFLMQRCLLLVVSIEQAFLSRGRCDVTLESMETMDWNALAAILDLICPRFGGGLLLPEIPLLNDPVGMTLTSLLIAEKLVKPLLKLLTCWVCLDMD